MIQLVALRLSIFIIASFSALSAVAGLGAIFHPIYWFIVYIGIGLELGKYSVIAYMFSQWTMLKIWQRIGISLFVTAIAIMTSVGIYGFLGTAFKDGSLNSTKSVILLQDLETKKLKLESKIASVDKQVADLPPNFVTGRIRLIKEYEVNRSKYQRELDQIDSQLTPIKNESLDLKSHMGPVVYMAELFNVSIDKAVSILMLALTLCLDPFAIFLTILVSGRNLEKLNSNDDGEVHQRKLEPVQEPEQVQDTIPEGIPDKEPVLVAEEFKEPTIVSIQEPEPIPEVEVEVEVEPEIIQSETETEIVQPEPEVIAQVESGVVAETEPEVATIEAVQEPEPEPEVVEEVEGVLTEERVVNVEFSAMDRAIAATKLAIAQEQAKGKTTTSVVSRNTGNWSIKD